MKIAMLAALCALIAGCAAQVISSTDRTVVVKARMQDTADAQALATAECQKHGLKARLSGKLSVNQFVFDCVS